ncbi:MAG: hypothetical protein Q8M02_10140 [Candidatus Didemnitutus sp.]|nr:hypothetical protein [Candidatus Didemnitutus sp.]
MKLKSPNWCAASRSISLLLVGGFLVMGSVPLWGQANISVYDTTGWTAWTLPNGSIMTDPRNDQQTGQGADDFVGDSTYAGFQQKAGLINSTDHLLIRARFDKFDAVNQWGNGGNFGLGMDIDGNGSIDLIMVMTENSGNVNNRVRTVSFGTPGTGANTGPSTTSWTFPSQTAITLTRDVTYRTEQASDGSSFGGNADAWVTFGLSFASLQNAIRTYAKGDFSNYVFNYESNISYITYTSTQTNALNQDLFGATGGTSSSLTWGELGAITPPISPYGGVPEPATYAQLALLLLAGGYVAHRQRRTAKSGRAPARVAHLNLTD